MEYKIMGGLINLKKYQKSIDKIENKESTNREREGDFRTIAIDILQLEKFTNIYIPLKSQSIPFDFIAQKNKRLALVEMKGSSGDSFNYSKETQYARLLRVINRLHELDIKKHNVFLLQINSKYGVYQILTQTFYDLIFKTDLSHGGGKQSIEPGIEIIKEYLRKYKL